MLFPLALSAANAALISYRDAAPIFAALREDLYPQEFRGKRAAAIESAWPNWVASRYAAIRQRVTAGDEDSVVYFLLFGTSFTSAPRITSRELATLALRPDAVVPSLPTRIDALMTALAGPRTPRIAERLGLVDDVLTSAGVYPVDDAGKRKARQYLDARVRAVAREGLQRLEAMADASGGASTIFRDRGLASDSAISTNFGVDRALADHQSNARLRRGTIRRVAIVGPGLDVVDKQFGYDFYPPQTIQPFAVIDSLVRSGLAAEPLTVTTFDVSLRVNAHLITARERARTGMPYTIVLTRDVQQSWAPELIEYWNTFGSAIGSQGRSPMPPENAGQVEVRAVTIPPAIVRELAVRDVNVVLEREAMAERDRFDLVIATNVLLYYDVFEQSLALANIGAMLRTGGVLLSNTRLVELPGVPMAQAGHTDVVYTRLPGIGETGDRVFWYVRQ